MTDFISRSGRGSTRNYKRRLIMSKHAIERFRERVDEEFRHNDDEHIGNLLDERISRAEFSWKVRDPRAPDDLTSLLSVACRDATYYAVVRDGTVVTLLDEQMARNNFKQWTPVLNTPFDALRGLKIAPSPVIPEASPPPSETAVAEAPDAEDSLAQAGIAYARARRQLRACEAEVAKLKTALDRATEAQLEAELSVESTHRHLIDLANGGEPT